MAEEPAPGGGRGEDPASGPVPGGLPPDGNAAGRAHKPARGFASGGPLDAALPGPDLVRALDEAGGAKRRCEGASDDEVCGMLGRWEAAEAWCAAARLGVIRELLRRRMPPGSRFSSATAGGLAQEVSNQLGVSLRAADALIGLAADLESRLVLTREALAAGVISLAKAKIIAEATAVLDDQHAAVAETLIAGQLAGKTPGQVAALIARAVVTVDPEGAARRRERAQREDARVRFWREHAGTAALAAFGLPPDEALAANQHIQDRALAYKAAGMAGTMDQLRVRAFLDALNGTDSRPAPGTWHLRISGRDYTVKLIPLPVTDCDHRYESGGYRPGTLLRHLVEVRDGQCTQPTCVRAARRCDFEHAVPWDQGGRTCACNGGCRCRRDHRVKQSPGWQVEQLPGGLHRWTTPSGRTYTGGPMQYPI